VENHITITHQPLSNPHQFCRLPVLYQVEKDAEINAPVVHCAVDIPREYIPAWLHPMPMGTTHYSSDGMHMVLYNLGDVVTVDAVAFCRKLYTEVMVKEKLTAIE
jgi:hypothetical protein